MTAQAPVFSSPEQLEQIAQLITNYLRLPVAVGNVPGAFVESALAHIRGGQVLKTYDFVDVLNQDLRCGWQVKSTQEGTPLTWKRAKLAKQDVLIKASKASEAGLQDLGDAIIKFCNDHVQESISKYQLTHVGYARLICSGSTLRYFERQLATKKAPFVFKASDFTWKWSVAKKTVKKEQLPALHGVDRATGSKVFAWHGLGENQLHFSGERLWWPEKGDSHLREFSAPLEGERLDFQQLADLLSQIKAPPLQE